MRQTGWALDVLAEEGYRYDSSIYPVRHDRYGVPDAPLIAVPRAHTGRADPRDPAADAALPVDESAGGRGRLLPPVADLADVPRHPPRCAGVGRRAPAMLYFHPWEFDPGNAVAAALAVAPCTYTGIEGSRERLCRLLSGGYDFETAMESVRRLRESDMPIPEFRLPMTPGDSGDV